MITAQQANDITFKESYKEFVKGLSEVITIRAQSGLTEYLWNFDKYSIHPYVLNQVLTALRDNGYTVKEQIEEIMHDPWYEVERLYFFISWE